MINNYLEDKNLIICPNNLKKKVILEINNNDKLIQYKIMSINEFLNNYFFSYNKKTVEYIVNKLNVKVEIALEYLNNLYYIEDKEYNSKKLNELVTLKKELMNEKLLEVNDNFKNYLKNVKIIVIGYNLDKFYIDIFSNYNKEIIDIKNDKKDLSVIEFNNIDDEVAFICYDIKNKLDNGININNIKIVRSGNEYDLVLKRIFSWVNIPINLSTKISLYNTKIGKEIINYLNEGKNLNEIIELINGKIDSDISQKIVNIFNEYVTFDQIPINMIKYDLKHTYIKENKISNSIDVVDIDELEDECYAYLIGFNKENYPKIYKDEDFLSDIMKKEVKLDTSSNKNKKEKEKLKNDLYRNINYIITYKINTPFDNYNPSIIITEEEMKVLKDVEIKYNFSHFFNKVKLSKEYDKYDKYGILSDNLKLLKETYKDLKYNTYDNKFNGINKLNKDKIYLSYSSIDNYFRCSFRYYLSSILKIDEESKDDFKRNIGTIYHYVLEHYKDDDFDLDKLWNEKVSEYDLDTSKQILLDKLKRELILELEIIKKQEDYTKMNEYKFEEKFEYLVKNKDEKDVYFTGRIDKIVYKEINDNNYISIIDYKTGTPHLELNNIIYGINMQLPIYMHLINKSDLFKNVKIVGFYLQKIALNEIKETKDKTKEELLENELKLQGYSNSDPDILSIFDTTYENSMLIKSMKTTKDGNFSGYSKILSDEELEKIDKLVDKKINEVTDDILNLKFDINPKKIDEENIGCLYCPYKDICFKKETDCIELEKYKDLSFLEEVE